LTVRSNRLGGPAIRAVDPWIPGSGSRGIHQLLSEDERARLATIASIVRFKKGEQICSEGEPLKAIFNIISGVVKAYRTTQMGNEHIVAFLYAEDLLGLSEEGRYTNSAKALTPVTAYALPTQALQRRLSNDPQLDFHVIAKLCQELRQAQRHALLLAQRHASSKLAMFLQLLEHIQSPTGAAMEIYLPMNRSDIADYVGMSLAAVSRGFRVLAEEGVISCRDRRHVRIIDRRAFENLGHEQDTTAMGSAV
jgi:CRP-like cAMP-binding protein